MNSVNYNLDKFNNTEIYDISKFNDNSDLIDKEINRIYEVSDITEPKENKIYNVFITSNTSTINGTNVYKEGTNSTFTLKGNKVYSLYYKDNNFYVKLSSSGNATPEDVKSGRTFTNESGEELTGTSNKIYGGGDQIPYKNIRKVDVDTLHNTIFSEHVKNSSYNKLILSFKEYDIVLSRSNSNIIVLSNYQIFKTITIPNGYYWYRDFVIVDDYICCTFINSNKKYMYGKIKLNENSVIFESSFTNTGIYNDDTIITSIRLYGDNIYVSFITNNMYNILIINKDNSTKYIHLTHQRLNTVKNVTYINPSYNHNSNFKFLITMCSDLNYDGYYERCAFRGISFNTYINPNSYGVKYSATNNNGFIFNGQYYVCNTILNKNYSFDSIRYSSWNSPIINIDSNKFILVTTIGIHIIEIINYTKLNILNSMSNYDDRSYLLSVLEDGVITYSYYDGVLYFLDYNGNKFKLTKPAGNINGFYSMSIGNNKVKLFNENGNVYEYNLDNLLESIKFNIL